VISIKKNKIFITILLLAISFTTYSMNEHNSSEQSYELQNFIENISFDIVALEKLFQRDDSDQKTISIPHLFFGLPTDVNDTIIDLLLKNCIHQPLATASFTLRILACVNWTLNKLINNRDYCLNLIKIWAKKYNHSDEMIIKTLYTKEAQWLLFLQNQLKFLCLEPMSQLNTEGPKIAFEFLCKHGVDLEFLYGDDTSFYKYGGNTPLILASTKFNDMVTYLLAKNVNVNQLNNLDTTALIMATECSQSFVIQQLLKNPHMHSINQQNKIGQTALWNSLYFPGHRRSRQKVRVQLLLDAGADPTIGEYQGLTPLGAARKTNNQDIIAMMEQAIAKKETYKSLTF
jgi:Ankyrin repeat